VKASELASVLTLLRFLGPLGGEKKPAGIAREIVHFDGANRGLRAARYSPPNARGVYLLVPGLHFLGPDDVRLDRFAAVLASAGFVVVVPFIPDLLDLTLRPTLFSDGEAAFAYAAGLAALRGMPPPGVFSISFGSLVALHLASKPELVDEIGGVILFGGYADLFATVRFAVTGHAEREGARVDLAPDPLNSPVIYLNLLPHLEMRGDRERLGRAYRTMVRRTWGRMELKAKGARDGHAHAIAASLPEELRTPFLRGAGLAPDALPWLDDAIIAATSPMRVYQASSLLPNVHARITLVHGRDDDVIPFVETEKLAAGLPRGRLARKSITGLYGHTGAGEVGLRALGAELRALTGMLSDMVHAPVGL